VSAVPPRRWAAIITGLVVALVVPAVATSFSIIPISENDSSTKALLLNEGTFWALALIILAIVRFWEGRPLGSIGLVRPTRSAILFGAKIVLVLIALALAAGLPVQSTGLPMPEQPAELVISLPVWLQLFVALSAGFTEEVLFRGYAIERMTELTGNRWIGALLPILVFGAAHASFWGIAHAIVAGFTGLWLSLLYLWRRNLWTNITAHALLDGLVFLVVDAAMAA
jgi:membrane protease YdiL (CAAX protease family)